MSEWHGIVGKGFTTGEFDAYVRTLTFATWKPTFIVLHNTAVPTFAEWRRHPGEERMHALEKYYRDEMHWSAGPHLFVADDLIWVFTPLNVPGVHSPSWNQVSWGVELVGDYETEILNENLRSNAIAALASLHWIMKIDPRSLRLHREDSLTTHKTCPGKHVVKEDVINNLAATLSERPPLAEPAAIVA
jgi:N-acetylmuramoyl-L-alanine amidase